MEERFQISKYLRVVTRTDGFALYHSLYGGLCIVDKHVKEVLDVFHAARSEREALHAVEVHDEKQISSLIKIFASKGFLVSPGVDEYAALRKRIANIDKYLHMGRQIGVVQLVVSNLCNLRCEYCFLKDIYSSKERFRDQAASNNRMMSVQNARVYLENIIRIVEDNGKAVLSVQFFGGEPLTNWKVIKSVLQHFGKGDKYGIDISYSIVTNGSLCTDEIAEYCKHYNVTVIVSCDSPTGKDRVYANGKNSIDAVKRGLSLLKKYGNRIVLNSVLSEETFQVFGTDLVEFALHYYIFEIGVLLDLDPEFYEKRRAKDIVERLWSVYVYGKERGVVLTGYWHMIFQQIASHSLFRVRDCKTCSGTGCQLSVEPAGDVFACKGSSGYFGNILELEKLLSSESYKKYAMRAFRNAPECDGCEIENFCSGFCLGPLEKKYGSIYVVERKTCNIYKELTKRLIKDAERNEIETYRMPRKMGQILTDASQ